MDNNIIILILKLILGLILCFAGLRLRKAILPLFWFVILFNLASTYTSLLVLDEKIILLLNILAGLIGAFFSYNLEALTVYVLGFYAGFNLFTTIFGTTTLLGIVGGIVLGIIIAIIGYKLFKLVIIISTSWIGAGLITPIIYHLVSIPLASIVFTAIVFVLGVIVQLSTNKKIYGE